MKEIRRSAIVFEPSNILKVLHGMKNAAAKFIRTMNQHHENITCIAIYCIVLISTCVRYVNCDIEPRPLNNQLIGDDGDGDGADAHIPVSK